MSRALIISPFYKKLLLILFSISSIVVFEPAPFDVLFFGTAFIFCIGTKFYFHSNNSIFYICLFGLVLTNIISTFFVEDLVRASFYLVITLYLFLLAIFLASIIGIHGENAIQPITKGLLVASTISVIVGILNMRGYLMFRNDLYDIVRIKGLYKDPNVFGPSLIFPILYLLGKNDFRSIREKYLNLSLACFFSFGIIFSLSRGAWGSFIIALCIFYCIDTFLYNKQLLLKRIGVTISAIILIALSFILIVQKTHYYDLFIMRTTLQSYDTDRFEVHKLVLDKASKNFFGIGPGHSELNLQTHLSFITGSKATHNTFLRVLWENGWMGLIFYLILLGNCLLNLWRMSLNHWRYNKLALAIFATLVGTIINSMVIDILHWRHFWILIGITYGLKILYGNGKNKYYSMDSGE